MGLWLGNGYGRELQPVRLPLARARSRRSCCSPSPTPTARARPSRPTTAGRGPRPDRRQRHLQRRDLRRPAASSTVGTRPASTTPAGSRSTPWPPRRGTLTPTRCRRSRVVQTLRRGEADPARARRLRLRPRAEHRRLGAAARRRARPARPCGCAPPRNSRPTACSTPPPTATPPSTDTYTLAGTGAGRRNLRAAVHLPRLPLRRGHRLPGHADPGQRRRPGRPRRRAPRPARSASSDPMLNHDLAEQPVDHPEQLDEHCPPTTPCATSGHRPGWTCRPTTTPPSVEFGMDTFYANYLRDLPPGTALPSDAGNAQQPDMGGGQVDTGLDAVPAVRRPRHAGRGVPGDEGVRRHERRRRARSHLARGPRVRRLVPARPRPEGERRQGSPGAGDCTSEVLAGEHRAVLPPGRRRREGRAGPGQDRRRWRTTPHWPTDIADRVQRRRSSTPTTTATATAARPPASSRWPSAWCRPPTAAAVGARAWSTRILNTDGGHLDTGIFGTRYLMDALASIGRTDVAMTVL